MILLPENPVTKPLPSDWRLICEPPPADPPEFCATLPELLSKFSDCTGWPLRFIHPAEVNQQSAKLWSAPIGGGASTRPRLLTLDGLAPEAAPPVDFNLAKSLAAALANVLQELQQVQTSLWEREAELATSVPVVRPAHAQRRLAKLLEFILHGGADAVDCDSAALYLLDSATSELKLRSAWGLPPAWFTRPARRLEECPADLEAMSGHAVVLENPEAIGDWNPPRLTGANACVPVASPEQILGSVWFGCQQPRPFSQRDTNIMELVAGRLAAELEREVAMQEVLRRQDLAPAADESAADLSAAAESLRRAPRRACFRCSMAGTWPAGPKSPKALTAPSTIGFRWLTIRSCW